MPKRYFNLNLRAWRGIGQRHNLAIPVGTAIRYRLLAAALSLAQKTGEDLQNAEHIKDPIFIVGYWRSGTTLLHELLAASGLFSFPTAYACMQPQTFLNRPSMPRYAASRKRPMDGVMVSPSSAMEEEFALLGLGVRSAYEAFLIPDAITNVATSCDPESWSQQEAEDWAEVFLTFLAACQMVGSGRRLALKSPTHIFRLDFLAKLFPHASYLYIEREPEKVFASTLAMWRAMWGLYAIAPVPDLQIIEQAVLDTMLAARQQSSAFAKKHLDRFHAIRFEDLVADPIATLRQTGEALFIAGLCNEGVTSRVATMGDLTRNDYVLSEAQKNRVRARLYG